MNVVIILPTYNERENIQTVLSAIIKAITPAGNNHKISYLVVDDSSPDGTQDVIKAYQKTQKNVYLLSGKKEGLGKALLRGMTYAVDTLHADIIIQMDADLSHDPAVLPKFIAAIDKGADFVVGSRYIVGGSIPDNWGLRRKIYSVIGNSIVRFGLGHPKVHDWTGGYRAFKKIFFEKAKKELHPYSGYVFQIAFLNLSITNGARITEVPIHFTDRLYGHSKIAPSEYIRKVIAYVVTQRIDSIRHGTFGKFLVVGTIGFIINTVLLEFCVRFLHAAPTIGSVIGAEFAIISNFILNNTWTFKHQKASGLKQIGKFFQFNLTSIGAVIIQSGTVFIGTFLFGVLIYRWFYLLGVGLGLIWNYWMYSHVIWKHDANK